MSSRSAAQLRADFDLSFARAWQAQPAKEDFLGIRLGSAPYVLRLSQVAHLAPLAGVTRVPSPCSHLLGVMGFRGGIVPVVDLRMLMDCPDASAPRWYVIAAAWPLALAFDHFDGQYRVDGDACAAAPDGGGPHRHSDAVLRMGEQLPPGPPPGSSPAAGADAQRRWPTHEGDASLSRPVISLPAVLETYRAAVIRSSAH